MTRARWRPMFRILPDNRRGMSRRVVVEIEPHRGRGKQHVNRDARRRWSRNPRAAIPIDILTRVAAVIDLVTGVVNIVVLHYDPSLHLHRWGLHIHSPMARRVYVADAACQ